MMAYRDAYGVLTFGRLYSSALPLRSSYFILRDTGGKIPLELFLGLGGSYRKASDRDEVSGLFCSLFLVEQA
jgi:hypothetical protein